MNDVFIAVDGDDVGNRLECLILEGNEHGLREYSARVATAFEELSQLFRRCGASVLVQGGDTLLARAHDLASDRIAQLLRECLVPVSAGIGSTLPSAYLALRYAKCAGKGRLVLMESETVAPLATRKIREIRVFS